MDKFVLPKNPFARIPIKTHQKLAGRSDELKDIKYYLGQLSSGQSSSIALIGSRGVGKTSLLNGAVDIANDVKLLTVRIDLNEEKVQDASQFWIELFTNIFDPIYNEATVQGMECDEEEHVFAAFSGSIASGKNINLKFPRHVSLQGGQHGSLVINETFIASDFMLFQQQSKALGYHGIIVLIDEANCFSTNQSLLQQLRNIFQKLDGFGLIMAGTEELFPSLADVFSPIPRQFFKLEVLPFSDIFQTKELIDIAIPNDVSDILPSFDTVREVHELTGGDPSELQLYCHHMYKAVQDGVCEEMELHPSVLNSIAKEYRSGSSPEFLRDIEILENLDEKILIDAWWLRLTNITAQESMEIVLIDRGLRNGSKLTEVEIEGVRQEVSESYKALYNSGLSISENTVELKGNPLTASYWKSLAQVKTKKGFSWDDSSKPEIIAQRICKNFANVVGPSSFTFSRQALGGHCLDELRNNQKLTKVPTGAFFQLLAISHPDLKGDSTEFCTIDAQIRIDGVLFHFRDSVKVDKEFDIETKIDNWVTNSEEVFSISEIDFELKEICRRSVPTVEEMHRLARYNQRSLPREFGKAVHFQAIDAYMEGNIDIAIEKFSEDLAIRDSEETRNNRGFCYILKNDFGLAKIDIEIAIALSPGSLLFQYNGVVLEALTGDSEIAIKGFLDIIRGVTELTNEEEYEAILGLRKGHKEALDIGKVSLLLGSLQCLIELDHFSVDSAKDECPLALHEQLAMLISDIDGGTIK